MIPIRGALINQVTYDIHRATWSTHWVDFEQKSGTMFWAAIENVFRGHLSHLFSELTWKKAHGCPSFTMAWAVYKSLIYCSTLTFRTLSDFYFPLETTVSHVLLSIIQIVHTTLSSFQRDRDWMAAPSDNNVHGRRRRRTYNKYCDRIPMSVCFNMNINWKTTTDGTWRMVLWRYNQRWLQWN